MTTVSTTNCFPEETPNTPETIFRELQMLYLRKRSVEKQLLELNEHYGKINERIVTLAGALKATEAGVIFCGQLPVQLKPLIE